jgi:hypothetical protein
MPLYSRTLPSGFIAPCLPTSAPQPPTGELWLHEVKHDGFRVIARKGVKLYSRPGNDLTWRFPLTSRRSPGCDHAPALSTAEAVSCGEDGIASFDRIRYRRHDADVLGRHRRSGVFGKKAGPRNLIEILRKQPAARYGYAAPVTLNHGSRPGGHRMVASAISGFVWRDACTRPCELVSMTL